MSQAIASLPPTPRYVDYSAEIPGLEHDTIESVNLWSDDDGLSFADFLDVVNPLQHIPVISSIYRAVTGDEISLGARLLGGALFGGPIGILTAGVNAAFEEMSGGNIAEHAVALFEEITGTGDDKPQLALEPQTPKSESVAAMAPFGSAGQPRAAQTSSQNAPVAVPAPVAIFPPIKSSSIAPAIRAINISPTEMTPPTGLPHGPVSGTNTEMLRQGAMRLPTALNAPSRNSIAQFNGKPADAITRRISKTILDGQRAQAQLLLASLSGGTEKSGKDNQVRDKTGANTVKRAARHSARQPAQSAFQATARMRSQFPARQTAHPNLPPNGASAVWFKQAMDRALDKYQSSQGLKRAGGISLSSNP